MRAWPSTLEDVEGIERLAPHFQRLSLAMFARDMLNRKWFDGLIEPLPDQNMMRLLLSVYFFDVTGNTLWKKIAWDTVGVADTKTARKYIVRAEEMGLIESRQSPNDKRIENLHATPRLVTLIESELLKLFDELRELMSGLLEGPLPNTGAPLLFDARSPELEGLKLTSSVGRGLASGNETRAERSKRIKARLTLAKKLKLK